MSGELDRDPPLDLGPCCACDGVVNVRNIYTLAQRGPVPGTGWGCFVCGLPKDGAIAVVCDACYEAAREPRYVCDGYPLQKRRIPVASLDRTPFDHDEERHRLDAGSL